MNDLPPTVPREAFEMALAQADQWKAVLYTVTPALVGGIIFLFLRLQAFGERVLTAINNNTSALEGRNHGKD